MNVDAHCHVGEASSALDGPRAFARYLSRARASGIDHVVIMSAIAEDSRACNRRVASWVRRLRPHATGLVYVHAVRDRGRVDDLVREGVQQLGLRGIKAHRRDARLSREICEAARAFGLPVVYDPRGEIDPVEEMARAYPDVRFVVPHLGSFDDDVRAQVRVACLLRKLPNVWSDTAGVRAFDLLREAIQHAGAERFLFGSDGPYLHPAVELAKVEALPLSPVAHRRVVGENARHVFGLSVAESQASR